MPKTAEITVFEVLDEEKLVLDQAGRAKLKLKSSGKFRAKLSVHGETKTMHSGYHAFPGGWGNYFGAGVDGSYARRGDSNGATNSWHTVRINAAADGKVSFYLDGAIFVLVPAMYFPVT